MPDIDWDDMIVPRDAPVTLVCYNDDTAHLECGICGADIAWTEGLSSSRTMAFGDIAASVALHMDEHSGR